VVTQPERNGSRSPLEKIILEVDAQSFVISLPPKTSRAQSYCGILPNLEEHPSVNAYSSQLTHVKQLIEGSSPIGLASSLQV
jgi:hypothetical protein